ncbi:unnamed protein product [Allacma fusca]|uniref:Fucosyltransferase n=1 Tax=Allacma fusca TaxID=39272 RepID=A0A8J2PUV8_9HEXA|nr:unnamed protein product [Allacma fusca]
MSKQQRQISICGLLRWIFSSIFHNDSHPVKEIESVSSRTFLDWRNFKFQSNANLKKVLFWTPFYKDSGLSYYCIGPDSLKECPHSRCEFTDDKSKLMSSDAVIFHGRDLTGSQKVSGYEDTYIEMPKLRAYNQLWIFLMFEAPVHTWINLGPFDKVFNMTMTYRPDSDIHIPYGRVLPLRPGEPFPRPRINSTNEKGLVAWSVSNCYKTPSRRNEVVHELHKYIPIDIYGDCGSKHCTPYKGLCASVLECHQFLAKQYKFYLAFENSLCENYITEKFFDSLYVGMVPVVYGYGDYAQVAPKGSYIDATVFPSMKALAEYLRFLDRNPAEYQKYFKWRESFRVDVNYFDQAWCSLCTKLWTSSIGSSSSKGNGQSESVPRSNYQMQNLSSWWFHRSRNESTGKIENVCVDPTRLVKWDRTMFSFYGFVYYPNYTVKLVLFYGMCVACLCMMVLYSCKYCRQRRVLARVKTNSLIGNSIIVNIISFSFEANFEQNV